MIEYVKIILQKVSFDKMLFEKELIKGLRMLKGEELLQLKYWCYDKFADMHDSALKKVFPNVQEWTESGI
jgi:hypothetical protein